MLLLRPVRFTSLTMGHNASEMAVASPRCWCRSSHRPQLPQCHWPPGSSPGIHSAASPALSRSHPFAGSEHSGSALSSSACGPWIEPNPLPSRRGAEACACSAVPEGCKMAAARVCCDIEPSGLAPLATAGSLKSRSFCYGAAGSGEDVPSSMSSQLSFSRADSARNFPDDGCCSTNASPI